MTDILPPQNQPAEAEKISATKRVMRKISALAKRLRTTVFSVGLVLGLALSGGSFSLPIAVVPGALSGCMAAAGGGGFQVVSQLNLSNVLTLAGGLGITSSAYIHVRDYICTKLMKKADPAHIEDIADNALGRVIEGGAGFLNLPPQRVEARFHKMVNNSCADFYRKLHRQEALKINYSDEPAEYTAPPADKLIAERDFEINIAEQMRSVTKFFTKREAEVYLLAIEGHSDQDISEKIGCKILTVKKHRANYTKKMKQNAQKIAA